MNDSLPNAPLVARRAIHVMAPVELEDLAHLLTTQPEEEAVGRVYGVMENSWLWIVVGVAAMWLTFSH